MDAVIELYGHFDTQSAAENTRDRCDGAFRLAGIDRSSSVLLRDGSWPSALSLLPDSGYVTGKGSIRHAVLSYAKEIELMGTLEGSHRKNMPSTLLAVALAAARRHGDQSLGFWRGWLDGGGRIGALRELGLQARGAAKNGKKHLGAGLGTGNSKLRKIEAEAVMGCYVKWCRGSFNTTHVSITLADFLNGYRGDDGNDEG
jgi:hypothetical protein